MKTISVIILTYNQEEFVEKAINGVFMQDVDAKIELIISDDKSPDATDKVIKETITSAPKNIEVKYFRQDKNLGSTPNFYFALKQVTGDYITFCEGDDFWTDPQKLKNQLNFLDQNSDYAMCFHQVRNVSPIKEMDDTLFAKVEERDYTAEEIYKHWIVHTTSVFIKAEILKNQVVAEMYRYPDLLYFDTILYMSASLHGKIRGFTDTMSAYRRHDAGLSHGINHQRDLRHNKLDEIIGSIYGGKIRDYSDWQIFTRSRIAFDNLRKTGNYSLALKHLTWILKKYKKLKVYLLKKYSKK